jgi:hypothetical protein
MSKSTSLLQVITDNIVGNNGYYSVNKKKKCWRNSYLLYKTIKLSFIFESVF